MGLIMNTKERTFLEKLPMFLVAWSMPVFFVIMATSVLRIYPHSDVGIAILKDKRIFLVAVVGAVLNLCIFAVRKFKKNEKPNFIRLIGLSLLSLAYFTYYFGINRFVVAGICLPGIYVGILSAQRTVKINERT